MLIPRKAVLRTRCLGRRDLLAGVAALAGGTLLSRRLGNAHALPQVDPDLKLPIGMNLAGIADWEAGFPFRNVMWGARVWLTRNASGRGPWSTDLVGRAPLDSDGYPREVPFTVDGADEPQIVFTILPNSLVKGRYVLLFDGDGEFWASGGTKIVGRAPGRILLGMTHSGGELVEEIGIKRSARENPIRNIRIVHLEDEHIDLRADPFRPEFIDYCQPWHALRFMDWLGTNHSINRSWSQRRRLGFYTQVGIGGNNVQSFGACEAPWKSQFGSGVAIELCIELCNRLGTPPWFCVPHLADDEYIEQFARLAKERLDPGLPIYLEYSNELWNRIFLQSHWSARSLLAAKLIETSGAAPPWPDGRTPTETTCGILSPTQPEGTQLPERIAALFRRTFRIWEDVFSGRARSRLIRVCAIQGGWPQMAERTIRWVQANGGCDAVSPTGYFGPDEDIYARWRERGPKLTAEDVLADMQIALRTHHRDMQDLAKICRGTGLDLIVYEGGQHIQPEAQAELPYNPALAAVQTHTGMYDLYRQLFAIHASADCKLFMAFSSIGKQGTRWGSWGHLMYYGQDVSEMPKQRILMDSVAARPSQN